MRAWPFSSHRIAGLGSMPLHIPSPVSLWVRKNQRWSRKRFLTIERNRPDLLAMHPRPKKALGVGHGSARDAGGGFESGVVWKYGL
jgi:hypothetical protein